MKRHTRGHAGPFGSFLILILIVGLLVFLAVQMGWLSFSTHTESADKAGVQITVEKSRIKEDTDSARKHAEALGERTREEARALAERVARGLGKNTPFALESTHVELAPGAKADVPVTRSGELPAMQLRLTPEPGSGLLASSGEFKAGEKEAHITIEAPAGARSGTVSVESAGKVEVLSVTVKTQEVEKR